MAERTLVDPNNLIRIIPAEGEHIVLFLASALLEVFLCR
mgnify:CR=1 FL=1|jgi:hypothetical protein